MWGQGREWKQDVAVLTRVNTYQAGDVLLQKLKVRDILGNHSALLGDSFLMGIVTKCQTKSHAKERYQTKQKKSARNTLTSIPLPSDSP